MIFINDLVHGLDWLVPEPIGVVEDGWVGIVTDLLREIGAAIEARPGTTVDVLAVSERDGELEFDAIVDGPGADDQAVLMAVATASVLARARAASTCSRCGRSGRPRHRHCWPARRCDRHASEGDERWSAVVLNRASETASESGGVARPE